MNRGLIISTLVVAHAFAAARGQDADTAMLLAQLMAVGKEGSGNAEARRAWDRLVEKGTPALPSLLKACNGADPRRANWLRNAFDAIAEKALANGQPLPVATLHNFLEDDVNDPRARRLAYEWLCRVDPATPDRYLPNMLNDPSVDLRRDAVARRLAAAQKKVDEGQKDQAAALFKECLGGARDRDQVDAIAKSIKALTGESIDVAAHFGFIRQWMLIGPFDSTGGVGFAKVYPPEKNVDVRAEEVGKADARLKWIPHETSDPYGLVDLNKAVAKHMGAVAYGYAVVESARGQPVELRVGSNNAVKVWLNGEQLISHEEYHHNGNRMDQYVGKGLLKAGRNTILVKICQNEQKDEWAQNWSFQLRLCDAVGGAIPFQVVPLTKE